MCLKNLIIIKSAFLLGLLINQTSYADNHNLNEVLNLIQKDLKTLEKAVYSDSVIQEILKIKIILVKTQKMF